MKIHERLTNDFTYCKGLYKNSKYKNDTDYYFLEKVNYIIDCIQDAILGLSEKSENEDTYKSDFNIHLAVFEVMLKTKNIDQIYENVDSDKNEFWWQYILEIYDNYI